MRPLVFNKHHRKFLLLLPAVVLPFLFGIFFTLGGGQGAGKHAGASATMGLNTALPEASINPKALLDKKLLYEQAERDSLRKAQYKRQDPYRRDTAALARSGQLPGMAVRTPAPSRQLAGLGSATDPKADQLLQRIDQLKQVIHQPSAALPSPTPGFRHAYAANAGDARGDTVTDPTMNKLNTMLDKVIRIQHPEEGNKTLIVPGQVADEVMPADSGSNTIAAVIPDDQMLTAGTTIALRITDSIRVRNTVLSGGQLVYGVVSINNDRMTVHITGLREERTLYTVDLQVYDMDGLAGIHIPGVLSRDVVKQSADQGVSSLNVLNTDPSLGAEAASAGIQTAKTFLSHKVRQVRVSVRTGYQVLLRNTHDKLFFHSQLVDTGRATANRLPGFVPGGPILKHCQNEGMELALKGIWLDSGRLWFDLEWTNHSPIRYMPSYTRWYIRDRHVFRRTAIQELPLEPVAASGVQGVSPDSAQHTWTGFTPFALSKDKELVVEVGEKGGGRVLELVVGHKQLLKAKDYAKEIREHTDGAADHPL